MVSNSKNELIAEAGILRQTAQSLAVVSQEMEEEFQVLGEKLSTFTRRLRSNAEGLAEVRAQVAPTTNWDLSEVGGAFREGGAWLQAQTSVLEDTSATLGTLNECMQDCLRLGEALHRSSRWVRAAAHQIEVVAVEPENVAGVHDVLHRLEEMASYMEKTQRSLMQNSRSGWEELRTVWGKVQQSQQIEAKSALLQHKAEAQLEEMQGLIQKIHSSYQGLHGDSEKMLKNLNQIVVAAQFHDILRQQLEHIAEALLRALQKLSEGSVVSQIWAQQCVRIQLGQLAYVRSETEEMARLVAQLFEQISQSTQEQLLRVNLLQRQKATLEAGARWLEEGLDLLHAGLRSDAAHWTEIATAVETMQERFTRNWEYLNDLESAGQTLQPSRSQSRLLSSCKKSTAQQTFTRLFRQFQERSVRIEKDLSQEKESVQESLTRIERLLEHLRRPQDPQDQSWEQQRVRLLEHLQTFQNFSRTLQQRADALSQESAEISHNLAVLIGQLNFGERMEKGIQWLFESLEQLNRQLGDGLPEVKKEELRGVDLGELEALYTRTAEREIHQACLREPLEELLDKIKAGWDPAQNSKLRHLETTGEWEGDIELF